MALENLKSIFSTDKFNSSLDDGVGRTGVPQFIGFTNDRGFVFPKAYLPYTGGLHGGLSQNFPSLPPHSDYHSGLDNINKETNQFIYNYTFYPPFAGGLHGADIWHTSPPKKRTPFIQISKMTAGFGLIGHPVDFFSTWQGTNSYYSPVQKIPGFTKEFNLGGYSFGDGDGGNSKFIGISSNTSFDQPFSNTPDQNFITDFDYPGHNFGEGDLGDSSFISQDFGEQSEILNSQYFPFASDIINISKYTEYDTSTMSKLIDKTPPNKWYDNYNYDPRISRMVFGKTTQVFYSNSYTGTQFDDDLGGLFNVVTDTSDNSLKYSTSFRNINIPSGFVITGETGEVTEAGGSIFTQGNIVDNGAGYPVQKTAFDKFSQSVNIEPIKYNPSGFEFQIPESNATLTNPELFETRTINIDPLSALPVQLGVGSKTHEHLYNDDHTITDNKSGIKNKLRLGGSYSNSGFRWSNPIVASKVFGKDGSEPYIISDRLTDITDDSSRFWQKNRSDIDFARISQFLSSEAGVYFIGKQELLGLNTRVIVAEESVDTNPSSPTFGQKTMMKKAKGQRFKRWYLPTSTLAAGYRIGGGGSPNVFVDREFPLGEILDMIPGGNAFYPTSYSEYIGTKHGSQDPIETTFLQPSISQLGFLDNIVDGIKELIPGVQVDPKDKPKKGDKMTLASMIKGDDNSFTSLFNNFDVEAEKNGMPFYFKDLRDKTTIIFRGYITGLTENLAPSWSSENYIGRSEPVYIYERSERDISFTLTLFAQTIDELDVIYKKLNRLTSMCYPEYKLDESFGVTVETGVDTGQDTELVQTRVGDKLRMKPPLTKLRIGELFGSENNEMTGFIKSLTYSFPDNAPWETARGKRVPKLITASMTYQVIHADTPGISVDKLTKETKVPNFYGHGN